MYNLEYDNKFEFFDSKDEAKDAAQEDRGAYALKWKVLRDGKGKKIGAKSGKYTITKVKPKNIGKEILIAGPGPGALDDPRTVREFVEDMIRAGRPPLAVRAVALSCRWKHHMPAINAVLEEFSKN
jgi:hypothetical protein